MKKKKLYLTAFLLVLALALQVESFPVSLYRFRLQQLPKSRQDL